MTIRRYVASKDTTITNALMENLITRATSSNMGESDVLEVFSIYGQSGSNSQELSRVLMEFPIDKIVTDRQQSRIPVSGNVQFILKMSNTVHPFTLPKNYHLVVNPLSRSWSEGDGLDMEGYKDLDACNWISASVGQPWDNAGGDIVTAYQYEQFFDTGVEDLEIDITDMVEAWMTGSLDNYGVMLKLSSSYEDDTRSYYTKKFFARGSQYFFKRPWIEARYDATVKDDRGNFYKYNSFVPASLSYNTLYFYNRFKGTLYDHEVAGTGSIYVRLYESNAVPWIQGSGSLLLDGTHVAKGGWVSTGIYTASVGVSTNADVLYDFWFTEENNYNSDSMIGYGGPLYVLDNQGEENFTVDNFVVNIKNLKQKYLNHENARIQVFTRPREWTPNSYTSVVTKPRPNIVEDMYYRVYRIADNAEIVPYGTGSMNHTRLSFDVNGNYFNLDMSLFEPGYSYGLKFVLLKNNEFYENKEVFKFRVED